MCELSYEKRRRIPGSACHARGWVSRRKVHPFCIGDSSLDLEPDLGPAAAREVDLTFSARRREQRPRRIRRDDFVVYMSGVRAAATSARFPFKVVASGVSTAGARLSPLPFRCVQQLP